MIKAIFFDLDGVLVDACEWHYVALNKAMYAISGFTAPRGMHNKYLNGLPTKQKLNWLVEQGHIQPEDKARIWSMKQALTTKTIEELAKPDPEKIELLNELKNDMGMRLACITNAIRQSAELMLRKSDLLDFFDILITNEDVLHPKPDPQGYLLAIQNFDLRPKNCCIIEDSDKGVLAARRSGAHVIVVDGPHQVNKDILERISVCA